MREKNKNWETKFLKIKFLYVNIIYYDKSILPRFFSEYIDLNLWSLKNVDVERWFFKLIKKRGIENDMYNSKNNRKIVKIRTKIKAWRKRWNKIF